jgi:hypothetical protein
MMQLCNGESELDIKPHKTTRHILTSAGGCLQLGYDVRIFLTWTRKLRQLSNSTLPLNATTADTTDILSHVQVGLHA